MLKKEMDLELLESLVVPFFYIEGNDLGIPRCWLEILPTSMHGSHVSWYGGISFGWSQSDLTTYQICVTVYAAVCAKETATPH